MKDDVGISSSFAAPDNENENIWNIKNNNRYRLNLFSIWLYEATSNHTTMPANIIGIIIGLELNFHYQPNDWLDDLLTYWLTNCRTAWINWSTDLLIRLLNDYCI